MPQQLNRPPPSAALHQTIRPLLFYALKGARTPRAHVCASLKPPNPQHLLRRVQRAVDYVNPARILQQIAMQQHVSHNASAASPVALPSADQSSMASALPKPEQGVSCSNQGIPLLPPQQLGAAVAKASSVMPWLTVEPAPAESTAAAKPPMYDATDHEPAHVTMLDAARAASCGHINSSSTLVDADAGPCFVVVSQPQELTSVAHWTAMVQEQVPGDATLCSNSKGAVLGSKSSSGGGGPCERHTSTPGGLANSTAAAVRRYESGAEEAVQQHSSGTMKLMQQYSGSASQVSRTVTFPPATPINQLRFAEHLAVVSNGCAPPLARFESLGWLLFQSNRAQAALGLNTTASPADPQTLAQAWLATSVARELLEQIYLTGQALADLGTADGLQPLSCSNGSRAIVSMDYAKLLERYLQQHGQLLAPDIWVHLPEEKLQAKAIHVSTCLETRCHVHSLLFNKLIERVGLETAAGSLLATAAAGGSSQCSTGPLAAAITNTVINTSQLVNTPTSCQSVVAAPSASAMGNASDISNTNNNNNNNTSSSASTTSAAPLVQGGNWLNVGSVGAVVVIAWHIAGKILKIVIAVVLFAKDLAVQIMMLRAVNAAAKGLAAASPTKVQLSAALAGAAMSQHAPEAAAAARKPREPGAAVTGGFGSLSKGGLSNLGMAAAAGKPNGRQQLSMHADPVATAEAAQQAAAAAVAQHAADNRQMRTTAGMVSTGALGLLCAAPVFARQASKKTVQSQQLQPQPVQGDAPQATGRNSKKAACRQQQRRVGMQPSPQLLYQLWVPEAARCA